MIIEDFRIIGTIPVDTPEQLADELRMDFRILDRLFLLCRPPAPVPRLRTLTVSLLSVAEEPGRKSRIAPPKPAAGTCEIRYDGEALCRLPRKERLPSLLAKLEAGLDQVVRQRGADTEFVALTFRRMKALGFEGCSCILDPVVFSPDRKLKASIQLEISGIRNTLSAVFLDRQNRVVRTSRIRVVETPPLSVNADTLFPALGRWEWLSNEEFAFSDFGARESWLASPYRERVDHKKRGGYNKPYSEQSVPKIVAWEEQWKPPGLAYEPAVPAAEPVQREREAPIGKKPPHLRYIIKPLEKGNALFLQQGWNAEFAEVMRGQNIRELVLDDTKGWRHNGTPNLYETLADANLRAVRIIDDTLTDASFLGRLPTLESITLDTRETASFDCMHLPKLESLTLARSASALRVRECPALKALHWFHAEKQNIADASALPGLEEVTLGELPLTDCAGLHTLRTLKRLRLCVLPKLESLVGLQSLIQLEELYIYEPKRLVNLSPLRYLPSLRKLVLWGCGDIPSLEPLRELKHLESVALLGRTTNIVDGNLRVLRNLKSLKRVRFTARKHYKLAPEDFPEFSAPLDPEWGMSYDLMQTLHRHLNRHEEQLNLDMRPRR